MPEAWVLWDNAVPDAVSHRVERSDGDNLNFVEVFSAAQADEDYKETLPDGDYWYRVRSELTPGVFSNYSNEAQVTLGSAPAPALWVEDTFTDVNGTTLDLHTPDQDQVGNGWQIVTARDPITIDNNEALSGGRPKNKYNIDVPAADMQIELDMVAQAGVQRVGVHFRNLDTSDEPSWACHYQGGGQQKWRIFEQNVQRQELSQSEPVHPCTMTVLVDDETITFDATTMIGGPLVHTGASRNKTTANAGVYMDQSNARSDNFRVRELP